MSEIQENHPVTLPEVDDKVLQDMNQLMADRRYRIKQPAGLFRIDKVDLVSQEFILYTMNDFMGHIQQCVASTRKMLPFQNQGKFLRDLGDIAPAGARVLSVVNEIDLRKISAELIKLQETPRDISVARLIPFMRLLFTPLIKVYYLGPEGMAKVYRTVYLYITKKMVPADPEGLKQITTNAIEEWYYILETVCTGLYPLLLRMTSPAMLTMYQLFYTRGSRILSWLDVVPEDVLLPKDVPDTVKFKIDDDTDKGEAEKKRTDDEETVPEDVAEGLDLLERLFPEAGWDRLETLPDMCAYFQPILQFQDAFTQLAPDNPLHQTMILFWILEELFQGLRLIKFEALAPVSTKDDVEDIQPILEQWILYQETIFDKTLSAELKSYTHQIYTQPNFHKSPYGRKLLSNMYTMIKNMFLPHFDVRMYGYARLPKDDRLPPFYIRVRRLRRLLTRYNEALGPWPPNPGNDPDASVPGVMNPWEQYKFDIANPVSRRLDAICGGKMSKIRTNAMLIHSTLMILNVLDWWINDRTSFAYQESPEYLYRVIEPGSSVPAFGVQARNDVETLFIRHLKENQFSPAHDDYS